MMGPLRSHFGPVTAREICELIVRSPGESCMLDFIPTSLMRQCLNDLVPLITAIINVSLSTCAVPKQFKQAVVIPLLKKPELDTNDLPVWNLPFNLKVLEKIVLRQLQKHLSYNRLLKIYQPAYRMDPSTETAVMSVLDCL